LSIPKKDLIVAPANLKQRKKKPPAAKDTNNNYASIIDIAQNNKTS
jgi:hypothetical protein